MCRNLVLDDCFWIRFGAIIPRRTSCFIPTLAADAHDMLQVATRAIYVQIEKCASTVLFAIAEETQTRVFRGSAMRVRVTLPFEIAGFSARYHETARHASRPPPLWTDKQPSR